MLALNVTVSGDKVVIANLQGIAESLPRAVTRGLTRVAKGIERAAFDWLSGPGRTSMRLTNRGAVIHEDGRITNQKTRLRGQADQLGARPGSYPVPILTGHLRRLLDWLSPGQSKNGDAGTFAAGPMEVIVYDSAAYADVINSGKWTSKGFGPRHFLQDGLRAFNEGGNIGQIIEEEIQQEITKRGMS